MEFVKLLNVGRFHSSIYHRLLDAIVSLALRLIENTLVSFGYCIAVLISFLLLFV